MNLFRGTLIIGIMLSIAIENGFSQKLIRGIVADSITLEGMPGVHCISKKGTTVSQSNGSFTLSVAENDTLTFSFIGYHITRVPVPGDDDTMFVLLREESTLMDEIVVRDTRLFIPKYIESPSIESAKPLRAASGSVNFGYFTKAEKEKRKLVAVLAELAQARTYIEIVNEPSFRDGMMKQYKLSEKQYFDLLAIFNQRHRWVMYSANEGVILNSLHSYFAKSSH